MSSSQSNAAARRRRAAPAVPPTPNSIAGRIPQTQPPSQRTQNVASSSASSPTSQQQPMYANPAQMLIAHEGRITKLEETLANVDYSVVGDYQNTEEDLSLVKELEDKIAGLEHELKMVMSFAMETNVALMKFLNNTSNTTTATNTTNEIIEETVTEAENDQEITFSK
jgi:hypothetical protein